MVKKHVCTSLKKRKEKEKKNKKQKEARALTFSKNPRWYDHFKMDEEWRSISRLGGSMMGESEGGRTGSSTESGRRSKKDERRIIIIFRRPS